MKWKESPVRIKSDASQTGISRFTKVELKMKNIVETNQFKSSNLTVDRNSYFYVRLSNEAKTVY